MKHILCLIDSLGAGGAQRQLVGLAIFLKEKGYNVTVAIYHEDLFYANDLLNNGVQYVYLKEAERNSTRLFQIARYIRKVNPDVVISYLDTPNICTCFAKFFNRRFRLITSERNTTQHTGRKERIRFNLFRMADYVVPNAFSQADYIHKTFPFLSNKVVTIPNFVDVEYFTPPSVRKRKNVPEIMVAATIWPSKNTLGFIDAVAKLKEKGYQFHISWYGKDPTNLDYFDACQEKIAKFDVSEYIELKEKTNKIKDRYKEADFFCLPSFYEGTPNVICEAMACGLPILCSDVCDNSRYVSDGVNGFLFNPKETNTIVTAFEKMLSLEDQDYQAFCKASREQAEIKLSKNSFIDAYLRLIEQ